MMYLQVDVGEQDGKQIVKLQRQPAECEQCHYDHEHLDYLHEHKVTVAVTQQMSL